MSGTGTTWQKLEQAVDRLESALDRVVDSGAMNPQAVTDMTNMGEQSVEAEQRAQLLQSENHELRQVTDRVADRLDDAIGRLRTLLGE